LRTPGFRAGTRLVGSCRSHTGPVRLSYALRGPELAVAIPDGDLEVLVEVAGD